MMVPDVNKTIDFYKDILGLDLLMTVPEKGEYDWAIMKSGNVEIMFQSQASLIKELPHLKDRPLASGSTLYIETEDVRELYDRLKDHVKIIKELYTTFYDTREFSIEDLNGYILTFAEEENITEIN